VKILSRLGEPFITGAPQKAVLMDMIKRVSFSEVRGGEREGVVAEKSLKKSEEQNGVLYFGNFFIKGAKPSKEFKFLFLGNLGRVKGRDAALFL